jgi:hypothetical protein
MIVSHGYVNKPYHYNLGWASPAKSHAIGRASDMISNDCTRTYSRKGVMVISLAIGTKLNL